MTQVIISAIVITVLVTLILVVLLLWVKARITPSGTVKIDINDGKRVLDVPQVSCALGGYLLDINPFDQPGVEAYKKNMFRLLGKPQ